jgi:hypothetical protein
MRITGPNTSCGFFDCRKAVHARGYCQTHYAQFKRGKPYHQSLHSPCPMCRNKFTPSNPRDIYCSKHCLNLARRLRRNNLSVETFWKFYNYQQAKCAICERLLELKDVRIDHDHRCCNEAPTCGRCFRGFLCHLCNVGLGSFADDVKALISATNYLLLWNHPESTFATLDSIDGINLLKMLNEKLGAA